MEYRRGGWACSIVEEDGQGQATRCTLFVQANFSTLGFGLVQFKVLVCPTRSGISVAEFKVLV